MDEKEGQVKGIFPAFGAIRVVMFEREDFSRLIYRQTLPHPDRRKRFEGWGRGSKSHLNFWHLRLVRWEQPLPNLTCLTGTRSAIGCYQKAGFKISEGKTKTTAVNGKTWVAINMTIGKTEWKNPNGNEFQTGG